MKLEKIRGKIVWEPDVLAYIVRRQAEGAALREIAAQFGVGPESVRRVFAATTGKKWQTIKPAAAKTAIADPSYRAVPLGRWPEGMRFEDVSPAALARELRRAKVTRSYPPIGPLTRVPGAGRGMAIPSFGGVR